MGVNKSITIEGATFRFEVKSNDGVMHVSLSSDAIDTARGWVKPMQGRPYTEQELKF